MKQNTKTSTNKANALIFENNKGALTSLFNPKAKLTSSDTKAFLIGFRTGVFRNYEPVRGYFYD